MTMGIERDVCKGVYWINMKDEGPYGAVVAHTNLVPKRTIRGTYRLFSFLFQRFCPRAT